MKICSNNQQAEFFIALESAELIISDFLLEEMGNLTITIPFLTIDIWALIIKRYQTCLLVSFYFLDENECVR